MSDRNTTSGVIWLAIVLIAVSIATSTMGLFMDSWRTAESDEKGDRGWGLTSVTYDCTGVAADDDQDWCKSVMIIMDLGFDDAMEKYGDDEDEIPLEGSIATSEMCENLDELSAEDSDDVENCIDTRTAGNFGNTMLWIGFSGAIISLILCLITTYSRDSESRIGGGVMAIIAGLLMGVAVLTWVLMLPDGIGGQEGDWDAGVNFYLTLVGAFLSLVAGIIALVAKRKEGSFVSIPGQLAQQKQW